MTEQKLNVHKPSPLSHRSGFKSEGLLGAAPNAVYSNGGWQWMLNPQGRIICRVDAVDGWQLLQPQQIPHIVRRYFGKP